MPAVPDAAITAPSAGFESRLETFANRVRALSLWHSALAAIGAGAVSILALPPLFLWPVLLVTLPVLVWLIDGTGANAAPRGQRWVLDRRTLLRAGFIGWCFGLGFHVAGLYWLREAFLVTGGRLAWLWPLGVVGLPTYLAVYHGMAATFTKVIPGGGMARVATLAVGLGMSEWLRGHVFTGFPWNVLGMALTGPITLMQSAAVFGIYGLTVLTVLVLAGPLCLLVGDASDNAGKRTGNPGDTQSDIPADTTGDTTGDDHPHWLGGRLLAAATVLVLPLTLLWIHGTLRLSFPPPPQVDGVRLRLVQPSIVQTDKWRADKQPEIIRKHIALSLRDATGRQDDLAGITHVIWPEAAMPYLPLQRPEVMAAVGEALPDGVHLLAGILRLERRGGTPVLEPGRGFEIHDDDRAYNSLAVFADDGRPIAVYDKTHLVPFGEYLPFQSFLEGIGLSSLTRQRGGFSTGPHPRPLLSVPGLTGAGPLICYESVFPGTSASSTTRPSVLINVTNDGWFGDTTGPRQHLHQTRLRTVEEGIPLMRVANNGISAAYDAYGRELGRLEMNVAGVIDTHLPGTIAPPLYARWGDLIFAVMCVFILYPALRRAHH